MPDLFTRARTTTFVVIGLLLHVVVAVVLVATTATALAWLADIPGGRTIIGAVIGLAVGAYGWYWVTTRNEARGGHLFWPGRVEDRWDSDRG